MNSSSLTAVPEAEEGDGDADKRSADGRANWSPPASEEGGDMQPEDNSGGKAGWAWPALPASAVTKFMRPQAYKASSVPPPPLSSSGRGGGSGGTTVRMVLDGGGGNGGGGGAVDRVGDVDRAARLGKRTTMGKLPSFMGGSPPAAAAAAPEEEELDPDLDLNALDEVTKLQAGHIFGMLDTNQDGQLQKGEVMAELKRAGFLGDASGLIDLLGEMDSDGDGLISLDELVALLRRVEAQRAEQMQRRMAFLAEQVVLAKQREANRTVGVQRNAIDPRSLPHVAWDMTIFAMASTTVVTVPLCLGWLELRDALGPFNLTIDAVMLVDVVKGFITGYLDRDGAVVLDGSMIASHYFRTWFAMDLVSSLPLDLILLAVTGSHAVSTIGEFTKVSRCLRLFRILCRFRIFHLQRISKHLRLLWQTLEERFRLRITEGPVEVVQLSVIVILVSHWVGCLNFMLCRMYRFPLDSWVVHADLAEASAWNQYQWSMFKALAQMVMIGYQTAPFTNVGCDARTDWCAVETWSTLLCLYIGAVIYAYLISRLSTILFNADSARKRFEDRLGSVNSYMRQIRLPGDVRERVRDYLHVKYRSRRLNDERLLLADLPGGLRGQIQIHITTNLFKKVPILTQASMHFLEHLAGIVESTISFPNETVLHEGSEMDPTTRIPGSGVAGGMEASAGLCMFFVESGIIQIMSTHIGGQTLCVIADGCYFGDVAVLLGGKRTATARAKTLCQLWAVPAAALLRLLADHPELSKHMAEVAEKRRDRILHLDRTRQLGLLSPEMMEDEEDMKTRIFAANAHRFSAHRIGDGIPGRCWAGSQANGKSRRDAPSSRGNWASKRKVSGGFGSSFGVGSRRVSPSRRISPSRRVSPSAQRIAPYRDGGRSARATVADDGPPAAVSMSASPVRSGRIAAAAAGAAGAAGAAAAASGAATASGTAAAAAGGGGGRWNGAASAARSLSPTPPGSAAATEMRAVAPGVADGGGGTGSGGGSGGGASSGSAGSSGGGSGGGASSSSIGGSGGGSGGGNSGDGTSNGNLGYGIGGNGYGGGGGRGSNAASTSPTVGAGEERSRRAGSGGSAPRVVYSVEDDDDEDDVEEAVSGTMAARQRWQPLRVGRTTYISGRGGRESERDSSGSRTPPVTPAARVHPMRPWRADDGDAV